MGTFPFCFNYQPWRFVISKGVSKKVKKCLSPGDAWKKLVLLIIAVASKSDLDPIISGRDYYPCRIWCGH